MTFAPCGLDPCNRLGPSLAKGAHRCSPVGSLFSLGAAARWLALVASAPTAAELDTVTLDWAYYNPVSLVLKQQGWLEEALKPDGIQVRWVQSLGSNKALEFLNAGSLDFGSTAGAAALLAKINGNPIETVWVYSKPEWTALVTRPDTGIAKVEDLKGKRIAVTKGTDPYIFLLRALEKHGLTAKDVEPGPAAARPGPAGAGARRCRRLGRPRPDDGRRRALEGLSSCSSATPTPTATACSTSARPSPAEHPEIVEQVLAGLRARPRWALANPAELADILAEAAKLPEPVAAQQLERTHFVEPQPGRRRAPDDRRGRQGAAGGGVIKPEVDVTAAVDAPPAAELRLSSVASPAPVSTGAGWPARRRAGRGHRRRRRGVRA